MSALAVVKSYPYTPNLPPNDAARALDTIRLDQQGELKWYADWAFDLQCRAHLKYYGTVQSTT
ncbi:hypothetical protein ABTA34_20260, partial [Acinetobacter baumannii]